MRPSRRAPVIALILLSLAACRPSSPDAARASDDLASESRLPNGLRLDAVAPTTTLGSMPLTMVAAPEADRVVLLLNGWREQGIQVVDRRTGAVLQTIQQAAAFLGLAFAPDGRTLYASGGNQDVVYRYSWHDGKATLADSLVLAAKPKDRPGTRYPAGLALSANGALLYVAENLADSLAVIDVASGRVVQRLATERYPVGVVVAPTGTVYVSAWGGNTLSIFTPRDGQLTATRRLPVGRHPSTMLLSADGARLFVCSGSTDRVAVVTTGDNRLLTMLLDPPPTGPGEGATPNALALSPDGTRLFVAEADANAIAVFDMSALTSGISFASGDDRLAGRIPVGWFPTALLSRNDSLFVVNGKGHGTKPNRGLAQPTGIRADTPREYTLGQLDGSFLITTAANARGPELARLTSRVATANGWMNPRERRARANYPPIDHVIYIVKENRTYDQVFGDLPQGDGDTALVFFPRAISPNHHALAERFGLYDRFFVNAEASPDGHNWSMGAYVSDYGQKTIPSHYSQRGRTYDYEGTNRFLLTDDDVNEPASGYLWTLAQQAQITFRNFGEFAIPGNVDPDDKMPNGYKGVKPFLAAHTSRTYPAWNLNIQDQKRADAWLGEFHGWVTKGEMPRLQILRLPNDHTQGARAGLPTPRAYMADNDLALGRIVEAVSKSVFWRNTVIFVLEDDAQAGPDHVDSHRSVLLTISAYNAGGVVHRFVNTTDVIATMEELLGLGSLSQFDHHGRPLRDIFGKTADLQPYTAYVPSVSLTETNPAGGRAARASERLDFRFEDIADEGAFNHVLWWAIKGEDVPYPGPRRMSTLEYARAR